MVTIWHRLDRFLARLRPHREPLSLLIDGAVVAIAWNVTYLFRLGFERWISAVVLLSRRARSRWAGLDLPEADSVPLHLTYMWNSAAWAVVA